MPLTPRGVWNESNYLHTIAYFNLIIFQFIGLFPNTPPSGGDGGKIKQPIPLEPAVVS